MTTMPAVRTDRQFHKGGQRFQDVFVDGLELRKEVKEGRTFKNLADYLIKYHGYKHFDLVAGFGKRIGREWYIRIRHKGILERILSPSADGQVWEEKKKV